MAYFGLFAFISFLLNGLISKRKTLVIIPVFLIILYIYATRERIYVWKDSISLFTDVIKKNDKIAFAWLNLGSAYLEKKDFKNALYSYNKGLQQKFVSNYDASLLHNSRGWLYISESINNANITLNDFNIAIKLWPSNASAYNNRGWTYYLTGKLDSAISDYNRAIILDSTNYLYYNNRGMVYNDLRKFQNAIKDFTTSIYYNPNYSYSYNNRGWAYMNLGNFNEAINDFIRAKTIDSNNVIAQINLANAYFYNKEYSKAVIEYKKIQNIYDNNILLYHLIIAEFYSGNTKNGCLLLDFLKKHNPTISDSLKNIFCK